MMRWIATALFLLSLATYPAQANENDCLGCHDFGPESPVHPLLDSPHGKLMGSCHRCHGPSEQHMKRPTGVAPDVSFGPRWTTTSAEQDGACLTCHARKVGKHWQDALHMANNITCVACHDLHVDADPIRQPGGQQQVCSMCHANQRDGIHAMHELLDKNPPCTTCHNPHADQRPEAVMLSNRSAGCRGCHSLEAMAQSSAVSARANSYHRTLEGSATLTCASCHSGVAHGPTDALEPFTPLPGASRTVTLFTPGQSDYEWIVSEHPGAQVFRQGGNCQRCHRSNERDMGNALGSEPPTWREIDIAFATDAEGRLQVSLGWAGSEADQGVAFMWGDDRAERFSRGGCWAACHSDMPGMRRDRGQDLSKYLLASRQQQQRIGQPPLVFPTSVLDELAEAGKHVELWKVDLHQGTTRVARLLSGLEWYQDIEPVTRVEFANGRWSVHITRPLAGMGPVKAVLAHRAYTLGLALHSSERPGAAHWVSLPLTFSLDGNQTDLRAE